MGNNPLEIATYLFEFTCEFREILSNQCRIISANSVQEFTFDDWHVNWPLNICSSHFCPAFLAMCPFINSKTHIQGPKGLYQVNNHFDCTTSNIIYCNTCTLFNKLYIGESGRKLGDRFREHLLDVKNKGSDLSKPVARHFNLPGHSHEHMKICGIYLHFGNNETRERKNRD